MSGILGDIESAVGGIASAFTGGGGAGGAGGGDFLSELMSMFGGGASAQGGSSGDSSTLGDIGKIIGEAAPLLALL